MKRIAVMWSICISKYSVSDWVLLNTKFVLFIIVCRRNKGQSIMQICAASIHLSPHMCEIICSEANGIINIGETKIRLPIQYFFRIGNVRSVVISLLIAKGMMEEMIMAVGALKSFSANANNPAL